MQENRDILMQILLLFNKNIVPRQLSLNTLPGLQQASLSQLNRDLLRERSKLQIFKFFFSTAYLKNNLILLL